MNISHKQFEVTQDQDAMRLDLFLADSKEGYTRSQAQKMIRDGRVLVDGQALRPKDSVAVGQKVEIANAASSEEGGPAAVEMPLDILFEDEELLILNKPVGLVVHEAAGHHGDTLINGVLNHVGEAQRAVKGGDRPGIVHRLDKDTSGCLAVAKTDRAYDSLVGQLADHSAGRTYLAWVWGNFEEEEATVEAPIGRHPLDRKKMAVVKSGGKPAVTHFTVKERAPFATLLEIKLETGRTHQIRVHLSEIGHAVVGDAEYGGLHSVSGHKSPLQRQALHAIQLDLTHPLSGKTISAAAALPPDFEKAADALRDMA